MQLYFVGKRSEPHVHVDKFSDKKFVGLYVCLSVLYVRKFGQDPLPETKVNFYSENTRTISLSVQTLASVYYEC